MTSSLIAATAASATAAALPPPNAELVSLLPIVLSVLAICVSVGTVTFTAYLQYFRRPSINIFISKWLHVWLEADGALVLNGAFTFTNSGAQYGVLTNVTGILTNLTTSEQLEVFWSKFITFENAGQIGETFRPHGSFAGWANYLVVPNRQVVAKDIQFVSASVFVAQAGNYTLKVIGTVGTGDAERVAAEALLKFEISEAKISQLTKARVNPETRISSVSVPLASEHILPG